MKEFIVYYYLLLRGLFIKYYNKLRNYLFDVKKIEASKNRQRKSIYIKYLITSFLTRIINMLTRIREYFNVKGDSIHLIKLNSNKQKIHHITDKSLVEIVKSMSKLDSDESQFNGTILGFDLHVKDQVHCLKKHLRTYGNEKHDSHT